MMKKVMFVLVGLLIVSTFAFALESGPSNKVGYVKIQCNGGAGTVYTQFGLPFKFWFVPTGNVPTYGTESRAPSSIVGSQTNCGTTSTADRISRLDNGQSAFRSSPACGWIGSLETSVGMEPGHIYFYQNKSGANRNLVLAGEADTTGVGIPTVTISAPATAGATSSTPYTWRDPRDVAREHLSLLTQGFTGGTNASNSDRILSTSGSSCYYSTTSSSWQGSLLVVSPGAAYFIQNRHVGHTWGYTYNATGQPIITPGANNNGPALLQKISAPVRPTATPSSRTVSK
jgi:hypothetical protein